MNSKGYTVLGWIVWQVVSRVAKRKIGQNRAKVGAAAAVAFVLRALGDRRREIFVRLRGQRPVKSRRPGR